MTVRGEMSRTPVRPAPGFPRPYSPKPEKSLGCSPS